MTLLNNGAFLESILIGRRFRPKNFLIANVTGVVSNPIGSWPIVFNTALAPIKPEVVPVKRSITKPFVNLTILFVFGSIVTDACCTGSSINLLFGSYTAPSYANGPCTTPRGLRRNHTILLSFGSTINA